MNLNLDAKAFIWQKHSYRNDKIKKEKERKRMNSSENGRRKTRHIAQIEKKKRKNRMHCEKHHEHLKLLIKKQISLAEQQQVKRAISGHIFICNIFACDSHYYFDF